MLIERSRELHWRAERDCQTRSSRSRSDADLALDGSSAGCGNLRPETSSVTAIRASRTRYADGIPDQSAPHSCVMARIRSDRTQAHLCIESATASCKHRLRPVARFLLHSWRQAFVEDCDLLTTILEELNHARTSYRCVNRLDCPRFSRLLACRPTRASIQTYVRVRQRDVRQRELCSRRIVKKHPFPAPTPRRATPHRRQSR